MSGGLLFSGDEYSYCFQVVAKPVVEHTYNTLKKYGTDYKYWTINKVFVERYIYEGSYIYLIEVDEVLIQASIEYDGSFTHIENEIIRIIPTLKTR